MPSSPAIHHLAAAPVRRAVALASAVLCIAALLAPGGASAEVPGTADPGPREVVAVVGESGLNVLHQEFRTDDGVDPAYPPGMPTPRFVDLPATGSFEERLAELREGPLSHLEPGVLYAVRGTRLLVIAPGPNDLRDVLEATDGSIAPLDEGGTRAPMLHGTGVVGSVAGATTGTDRDALVVFVTSSVAADSGWDWLVDSSWVDVVSLSTYSVGPDCPGIGQVREVVASGRLVFASAGNQTDDAEKLMSPNGLPEVYQVGGVDSTGRTWLPLHPEEEDPGFALYAATAHPSVSGDLFSFRTASHTGDTALQQFGGTSGATPRTAGRALRLIREARHILRPDTTVPGAYAVAGVDATIPAIGPLADGDLTAAELDRLLRSTARPFEAPSPARYLIEGYGAHDEATAAHAIAVLRGEESLPDRQQEDAAHAVDRQVRAAAFTDQRCSA